MLFNSETLDELLKGVESDEFRDNPYPHIPHILPKLLQKGRKLPSDPAAVFSDLAEPFWKSGEDVAERRLVIGLASTDKEDMEGEILDQNGMDFEYHLRQGRVCFEHPNPKIDPIDRVVGVPLKVHKTDGHIFYLCELFPKEFNHNLADKTWQLIVNNAKMGRPVGFSIEGRSRGRRGRRVTRSTIYNVVITANPVNPFAVALPYPINNNQWKSIIAKPDLCKSLTADPLHSDMSAKADGETILSERTHKKHKRRHVMDKKKKKKFMDDLAGLGVDEEKSKKIVEKAEASFGPGDGDDDVDVDVNIEGDEEEEENKKTKKSLSFDVQKGIESMTETMNTIKSLIDDVDSRDYEEDEDLYLEAGGFVDVEEDIEILSKAVNLVAVGTSDNQDLLKAFGNGIISQSEMIKGITNKLNEISKIEKSIAEINEKIDTIGKSTYGSGSAFAHIQPNIDGTKSDVDAIPTYAEAERTSDIALEKGLINSLEQDEYLEAVRGYRMGRKAPSVIKSINAIKPKVDQVNG